MSAQTSTITVSDFLASVAKTVSTDALHNQLAKALEDPTTLNRAVQLLFRDEAGWRLLRDLNVRFKTFETESARATLGLSYSYTKDVKRHPFAIRGADHSGLSFTFSADGNVAFIRALNPRDFMNTAASLHVFRSHGGAIQAKSWIYDELNRLEDSLTLIHDQFALAHSAALKRFLQGMNNYLTTQTYVDLSISSRLETDQAFVKKQVTYGGQLGFDVKAWRRNSTLARWNLFDWPLAAVRYLAGVDSTFTPRGSNIPTLQLGVDLVDPQQNNVREALGVSGSYPRFRFESGFRSLVLQTAESQVYFESTIRYYRELKPPAPIRVAGLQEFIYVAAAFTSTNGLYVGYSAGRLPLSAAKEQVYEVGFKMRL